MKYRQDIDGLRALAVLPVILFHAGFSWFGGGFVGVDVFFVISGFLITSVLIELNQAGNFSIAGFYERRARRILPVLFLVVATCVPFAWFWLLPNDLLSFARSVIAVALFASNLQFKKESGYFDAAAEFKPLLHTWSLSVEEQYYLLFPLFMMLFWRLGRKKLVCCLSVIALLSMVWAQKEIQHKPAAAYFLLSSRGWELLIGSATAFYRSKRVESGQGHPLVAEAASLFGFVLLAYAVLRFNRSTPFPGLYALVPTMGSALIVLFSSPGTVTGRLLGAKPFVGLGLISYSAYLWHQPLLAFVRYRSLLEPGAPVRGGMCMAALLLSYVSWRFVEKPFRDPSRFSRNQIFALSLVGIVAMLIAGGAGVAAQGYEGRAVSAHLPSDYFARSWIDYGTIIGVDGVACVSEEGSICRVTKRPGGRKILLLGDSHSADFTFPYRTWVMAEGLDAWQLSIGGCAFLPYQFARHDGDCGRSRTLVERTVRAIKFDEIIVVMNLDDHFDQIDGEARTKNMDSLMALLSMLRDSGANVTYFVPRPHFNASPTRAAALKKFDELKVVDGGGRELVNKKLLPLLIQAGFNVFDQRKVLVAQGCGRSACFKGHASDMTPLYRDTSHLTTSGAQIVFDAFVSTLANRGR